MRVEQSLLGPYLKVVGEEEAVCNQVEGLWIALGRDRHAFL